MDAHAHRPDQCAARLLSRVRHFAAWFGRTPKAYSSGGTQAGRAVDGHRAWALTVQRRTNHNKATCALANKLARICYACLRDSSPYGQVKRLEKKISRSTYPIPA